jgi:putative peptidoglycan lipid II flippase
LAPSQKFYHPKRSIEFWRTLTSGSTNRRIFAAVVTIASLTAVTRVAAVGKELVVAWRFGTGDTLEAYLMAYLIPTLGVTVLASSLNVSLIPIYIRVREHEGPVAAQKLLSGVVTWSLALLATISFAIMVLAPFYLPLLASGFDDQKLRLSLYLTYLLAPTVVVNGVANVWSAILNAGERFALVAITPIITPVAILFFLLLARDWGIFALAAGIVLGSLLELLLLGVALKMKGISLRPRWYGFDPHLRQVASQFSPRVAASLLRSGTKVVDRSMAAMLSAGSVAALNYGHRITTSLLSLVGITLGSAVAPFFSKMVAHKDWAGLRHTLKRYLSLIFLFTIPLTAGFFVFSYPIVESLYQRGSFTPLDTQLVSQVQALYVLQVPLAVATGLIARLLSALLAAQVILWAAAINFVLNFILNILFIRQMGVAGIALSTSCAALVTFCFMSYHSARILRKHSYNDVGVSL